MGVGTYKGFFVEGGAGLGLIVLDHFDQPLLVGLQGIYSHGHLNQLIAVSILQASCLFRRLDLMIVGSE